MTVHDFFIKRYFSLIPRRKVVFSDIDNNKS